MPGSTSTSREHRLRVLANQTRLATERALSETDRGQAQLKMPLLVEVKGGENVQPRVRRTRRRPKADQRDLGEL